MDMSKAFDMVDWRELFQTLLDRKIDPVYLRLLLYIYANQMYTVKWGSDVASYFNVSNGVRQGGVSSGIFFAVYIDQLITILRQSGFGCHIYGVFFGAIIYADDIFLLSASRTGLQAMIGISEVFASRMNLKFGTNINPDKSKTKCLIFSRSRTVKTEAVKQVELNGCELPWVSQAKHLGHTLQLNNSMKIDIQLKRGAFIGKVNSLLQEFHYSDPKVLLKLIQSYACNVYGSNTWDLFSADSQKLYTTYNVTVRNLLKIPRTTHRYLIESLTNIPHLYVQLLSRYVTFAQSLMESTFEIRFLARICVGDMRTTLGRSLTTIADLCELNGDVTSLSSNIVKRKVRYASVPHSEEWRVGFIQDILDMMRRKDWSNEVMNYKEASSMLDYACTA